MGDANYADQATSIVTCVPMSSWGDWREMVYNGVNRLQTGVFSPAVEIGMCCEQVV